MSRNRFFKRSLAVGVAMAAMAAAPARCTILFKPVGAPPEVFAYNGETISKPLTDTNALNSPKVYLIFVGPNFENKGKATAATSAMINGAKAILKSTYFSGLTQYGSDGKAEFGGSTIDTSIDPSKKPKDNLMYSETDTILSDSKFSSWLPPSGSDAQKAPIYVVARYQFDTLNAGGGYGGSNDSGPNSYSKRAVNFIDVALTSADQVDQYTWILSHELAERISTGTGSLVGTGPSAGNQICDGEPEGNNFYAARLPGKNGPLVTSYWSFVDQAYIIPDGNLDREMWVPMWNTSGWTGNFVSLQQGTLYQITGYAPQGTTKFVSTKTKIDSKVQSFVVNVTGGNAQIFDLTSDGEVKQYSGTVESWTTVSPSKTTATDLVSTTFLNPVGDGTYSIADGQVFMLADKKPYVYTGSGTNWNLMIVNTTVTELAAANGNLDWTYNPGKVLQDVFIKGYLVSGNTITDSNTTVQSIAAANGTLYMLAIDPPDFPMPGIFRYDPYKSKWDHVTDPTTFVYSMAVAGDVLCMLATGPGVDGAIGISEYSLTSDNWVPLTDKNMAAGPMVVQDGNQLFMMGIKGSGPNMQVFQYTAPGDWTALTDPGTNVQSVSVGTDNSLYMTTKTGGTTQKMIYNGKPLDWSAVK